MEYPVNLKREADLSVVIHGRFIYQIEGESPDTSISVEQQPHEESGARCDASRPYHSLPFTKGSVHSMFLNRPVSTGGKSCPMSSTKLCILRNKFAYLAVDQVRNVEFDENVIDMRRPSRPLVFWK